MALRSTVRIHIIFISFFIWTTYKTIAILSFQWDSKSDIISICTLCKVATLIWSRSFYHHRPVLNNDIVAASEVLSYVYLPVCPPVYPLWLLIPWRSRSMGHSNPCPLFIQGQVLHCNHEYNPKWLWPVWGKYCPFCWTSRLWHFLIVDRWIHPQLNRFISHHIDGLVHDFSSPSSLSMESLQSCINPSICYVCDWNWFNKHANFQEYFENTVSWVWTVHCVFLCWGSVDVPYGLVHII